MIAKVQKVTDLYDSLISEAQRELESAQDEYETHLNEFYKAKIVEFAAGDKKAEIVLSQEAEILQDDRFDDYLSKIAFWEKRLDILKKYDIGQFRKQVEDLHGKQRFIQQLFIASEKDVASNES